MNEKTTEYVQNQLLLAPHRLRGYVTSPDGSFYPKRYLYATLEAHVLHFIGGQMAERWILVPGLRGVGKTTAISQLFLSLMQSRESLRLLYVSLDEVTGLLNSNLADVLEAYEFILGERFEKLSEPIFLFVDEAQYDPQWGIALKSIYDRSKKVFICCTGSSAISLQGNADVQRRVIVEKLYPLNFSEYQTIRHGMSPPAGVQEILKQTLYFSSSAEEVHRKVKKVEGDVRRYWSHVDPLDIPHFLTLGTFPFVLSFSNPNHVYEALNGLLDKIILKDIESLKSFDTKTLQAIKRVLFLLADSNDVFRLSKLPNLVGVESVLTVQRIFSVLEQAELLQRIPPHGSSSSQLTKPSKYLFTAPAIRMALLGLVGKEATYHVRLGRLLEDIAALHFARELVGKGMGSIAYDPAQGGADFIVRLLNRRQVIVEIGIGKKGQAQVKKTMEKVGGDYGLVIGEGNLLLLKEVNSVFIPLSYFLLM